MNHRKTQRLSLLLPFLLVGLTAQTTWAQTPVNVNYTTVPAFVIQPALDLGGVTVTGSDDISVAPHAGVAVSGGPNVLATDAGETIQFSFNGGAAIDVTYLNNNVGGFPGSGVGFGAAIVEGFDVGGASLGTFEGCCFGTIDVSTPFSNVPLSRFTATAIVPPTGQNSFFRTGSLTYTPVNPVLPLNIDIKPGSFPNSINLGSGGVTPVAILGSASLDVTTIDPDTLSLGTNQVKTVGKTDRLLCSVADVSGDFTTAEGAPDGFNDLVCQFMTFGLVPEAGGTTAKVSGNLSVAFGGGAIEGTDSVNIVP